MADIHHQLALFGSDTLIEQALEDGDQKRADQIRTAAAMMQPPTEEELSFLHSGLCQTGLPHSRPSDDSRAWVRRNGNIRLVVTPGWGSARETDEPKPIGVPYGTRARLIMIYLQSEGVKSRTIPLGRSMSAWIKSLGLTVNGGPRGSITSIKTQVQRIANCQLKLEWDTVDHQGRLIGENMQQSHIVRGLSMWADTPGRETWPSEVELTTEFHDHLREHAVPLDSRAIAELSETSLGLDVYAFLAYRLPKLDKPVKLPWIALMTQFGAHYGRVADFAKRMRPVLQHVQLVYPDANIEQADGGLILKPSKPAIKRSKSGYSGLNLPTRPADRAEGQGQRTTKRVAPLGTRRP
ncbi:hypothetical protein CKO28_09010 [Rhodovibrio sodomensis]|uniref:Plasmid encoded RepA protein n=1 Tax=Rhodovibrio sodomensis TaxID=1088 RepID=A0ABS1DCP3_9PROT|nr:replication protein RepA [Rhodovibrio sodomensis]MBK1668175.1 hypothetical protein [Rhodovibrio sodomensis]